MAKTFGKMMMKAKPREEATTIVGQSIREELNELLERSQNKASTLKKKKIQEKTSLNELEKELELQILRSSLFTEEDMMTYSIEERKKIQENRVKEILRQRLTDTKEEHKLKKKLHEDFIMQKRLIKYNQQKEEEEKERKIEERIAFLRKKRQALFEKNPEALRGNNFEIQIEEEKERRKQAEDAKLKKLIEVERLKQLDREIQIQKQRNENIEENKRKFRDAFERMRTQEEKENHFNQLADICINNIEIDLRRISENTQIPTPKRQSHSGNQ